MRSKLHDWERVGIVKKVERKEVITFGNEWLLEDASKFRITSNIPFKV